MRGDWAANPSRRIAPKVSGGSPPPLVCSYVAAINPTSPSSIDLLGGQVGASGDYLGAATPWPTVVVTNSPSGAYGVVNKGTPFKWGIHTGVIAPMTITASWTWDLGHAYPLCTMYANNIAPITDMSLWLDGVEVLASIIADANAISPIVHAQLVEIRYSHVHGGGYYSGVDCDGFLIWGAR